MVSLPRRAGILAAIAAISVPVGILGAQCPDGSVPPCRARADRPADTDRVALAAAEAAAARRRVAVLYFEDQSVGRELARIADGLTEDLIAALRDVQGLNVVSRRGAAAIRGLAAPLDSIARTLRVGSLVTGVVNVDRDTLRVTVRLLDDAGIEMERAALRRSLRDPAGMSQGLASEVASLIRRRIGAAVRVANTRTSTRNSEAWLRYQRAVQARDRGDSLYKEGSPTWLAAYSLADSIAGVAEVLDRRWAQPPLLRGWLSYGRSRRASRDTAVILRLIADGRGHVNRALALDPNNADGLELRGTLAYWRWLRNIEATPERRAQLLKEAQADLERSVQRNPAQAGAYASLSHMYYNIPGGSAESARIAALKAFEADAFLENADVIMWRIVAAAYDVGRFAEVDEWCREGRRRFARDLRFVQCRLLTLAMAEAMPDAHGARSLADSLVLVTPPEQAFVDPQRLGRVLLAAALARAGERDSARSLLMAVGPEFERSTNADLGLYVIRAWMLLGDMTEALNTLKAHLARSPQNSCGDLPEWWSRDLPAERLKEICDPGRKPDQPGAGR
jgi:TolB-like protein